MSVSSAAASPRSVLLILAVWFGLALVVGLSGMPAAVLARVPPPVFVGVLTLVVLGTVFGVPALRAWARTVPLRWLVGYHAVRFVGIVFLVLAAQGVLPRAWAVPAGWGDIATAALALVVVFAACPPVTSTRWWAVLGWNVFGLLDITAVLVNGARLTRVDPTVLAPLTQLPLVLLPLFVVPLIVATHVLIFWRLARDRPAGYTASGG